MARVEVLPDRIVIRLTAGERARSLRRRDIVLSRAAITSAIVTDDPWIWLRGTAARGTSLPGWHAMGVWRGPAGDDFALVRSGRRAVVIDLDPLEEHGESGWIGEFDPFARAILSTTHAGELIAALKLDGDELDGRGGMVAADTEEGPQVSRSR